MRRATLAQIKEEDEEREEEEIQEHAEPEQNQSADSGEHQAMAVRETREEAVQDTRPAVFRHPVFSPSILRLGLRQFRRHAKAQIDRIERQWDEAMKELHHRSNILVELTLRTTSSCIDPARIQLNEATGYHNCRWPLIDGGHLLELARWRAYIKIKFSFNDFSMKKGIQQALEDSENALYHLRLYFRSAPLLPELASPHTEERTIGFCKNCYAIHPREITEEEKRLAEAWKAMQADVESRTNAAAAAEQSHSTDGGDAYLEWPTPSEASKTTTAPAGTTAATTSLVADPDQPSTSTATSKIGFGMSSLLASTSSSEQPSSSSVPPNNVDFEVRAPTEEELESMDEGDDDYYDDDFDEQFLSDEAFEDLSLYI